jgi:hypothetical protein
MDACSLKLRNSRAASSPDHSDRGATPGAHAGCPSKDGRLNLSVDVDVVDADVAVVVTVTPVAAGSDVDENGWPEGFFDRVAGSMPELRRGSQGDFEERLPLE